MKRTVILILLVTGLHFQSFSQNGQTHFTGGLFFGVNGTQINGDQMSGFNKSGLAAGGYINFMIDRYWNLQMEFLYTQKGSRAATTVDSGGVLTLNNINDTAKPLWNILRLNYFEVPVMIQYNITTRVYASAGLSFGYLVGIYREDFPSGQDNYTSFLKKTEFGANIGIGYFLTPHLTAYLRYSQSILPISEPNPGINYGGPGSPLVYNYLTQGMYNIVFTAGIYYNFTPKFKWPSDHNSKKVIEI